jgi:hypothetical protein
MEIGWPFNYAYMMTVPKDVSPDDSCGSFASSSITWDRVRRVVYATLLAKESGLKGVIFRQGHSEGHVVSCGRLW